ncbi:MAG: hypothetical protein HY332_03080 [Chloroflexi bacterium]|nr:hypothetical protein [Chloroflexota bacterium]
MDESNVDVAARSADRPLSEAEWDRLLRGAFEQARYAPEADAGADAGAGGDLRSVLAAIVRIERDLAGLRQDIAALNRIIRQQDRANEG